jgi:hypothetical protein
MHLPYTYNFPEAAAVASHSVAAAVTAVIWARPLRTRAANVLFGAAVWIAALAPQAREIARLFHLRAMPMLTVSVQISATLATVAVLLQRRRLFTVLAVAGQLALLALGQHVSESDHELAAAHLMWCGLLLGVHALGVARPAAPAAAETKEGEAAAATAARAHTARGFLKQDAAIFAATTCLALLVTILVFDRVIYNGDEVSMTFQADVYAHLRAWAPVPPCPSMFENYWVFHHQGRAFSQYTPGWPLFMAPFQRLGIIWLAGPVMAGLLAVALARLARRAAWGLGPTPEISARIVSVAGVAGAAIAMLGPAMLLNGASRFSHTMVCACFAWSVESLCVLSDRGGISRRRAWGYGLVLGAATSLGLATRPSDGGFLGVGVFLYFLWVLFQRRLSWRALLGTAIGFAVFGGLTLVILRLQVGAWFQTAYVITPSVHPEGALRLSWPRGNLWKYGIPLATGSYCWWPAAPALGIAGLVHALGGRERRVPFMLVVSALALIGFYFLVEFGRGGDDGLGPRYLLPVAVLMATGGGAVLAPLLVRAWSHTQGIRARIRTAGPAALMVAAMIYGAARIAPLMYPVAHQQYTAWAAPLRAARRAHLKNAIVIIEPGRVPAHETNLAQNEPMNPHPDVLFLIRRSDRDEACAREHFPGRTWYRAGMDATLMAY